MAPRSRGLGCVSGSPSRAPLVSTAWALARALRAGAQCARRVHDCWCRTVRLRSDFVIDLSSDADFVIQGDCAEVLPKLPDGSFQLIYIDPPFNTGKVQQRKTLRTTRADDGDRVGFQGRTYRTTELRRLGYLDAYDDYLGFIGPKLEEARR